MRKPDILYHASHNTDIDELEPRNHSPRFEGEQDLVFATEHIALAAMFLSPKGIPTEVSVFGDRYVIFINSSESEYKMADKGGAIYSLPSTTFETDMTIGMGENEWVSKVSVKPLSKIVFDSSIEAMNKHGVECYFVSDDTMKVIRADPANAMNLVR